MTSSPPERFSLVCSPSTCFCPSAFPGQSSPAGGNLSEACVMFHLQAFWVIGQWHSSSSISGLRTDDYNCSLSLRDGPAWPSFSQHDNAVWKNQNTAEVRAGRPEGGTASQRWTRPTAVQYSVRSEAWSWLLVGVSIMSIEPRAVLA